MEKRYYILDNAKFILILLVIFGHLIEQYINSSGLYRGIYLFIYSFHIPAFILIAGMLAKDGFSAKLVRKNFYSLIIPLFVFQILYEIFDVATTGRVSFYSINLAPYWILWFLLSLFAWRLMLPLFNKIKFGFLVSIILSVFVGYLHFNGYVLSISRTLVFFPFFLLGYRLSPEIFDKIKFPGVKILSGIIIIASLSFFIIYNKLDYHLFYGVSANMATGNPWMPGLYRIACLSLSFLLSFAFVKILPNGKTVFSALGNNSLSAYVWHGFVVKTIILLNIFSSLSDDKFLFILSSLAIATILNLALSNNVVKRFTEKITFQRSTSLLKNNFS